jgi:hypothetical protein
MLPKLTAHILRCTVYELGHAGCNLLACRYICSRLLDHRMSAVRLASNWTPVGGMGALGWRPASSSSYTTAVLTLARSCFRSTTHRHTTVCREHVMPSWCRGLPEIVCSPRQQTHAILARRAARSSYCACKKCRAVRTCVRSSVWFSVDAHTHSDTHIVLREWHGDESKQNTHTYKSRVLMYSIAIRTTRNGVRIFGTQRLYIANPPLIDIVH